MQVLYRQLKHKYAKRAYKQALDLNPAHKGSIINLFILHHNQSRWRDAESVAARGKVYINHSRRNDLE